ncbi:MAG: metallophosphoesterase [Rhodospirillales bacterium]
MESEPGAHLFDFAVVTDTHVNFGENECNSEFDVNKGANGRLRHVVRDINRRDLAFVIHLGDLVHPVPALPDLYARAADAFKSLVGALHHPLHLVPGNHDIGDKPIAWGPAGVVCDDFISLWKQTFGPNFASFDVAPCRFILLDAQIINSGLPVEAEQRDWLEAQLKEASQLDMRVFINLHYPPFLCEPDEKEHFDNIAAPGRNWLMELIGRHGVEAVFSGHVHNFWYNRHAGTDFYALPSTAFVRQDYTEIYRATPPPETHGGRADLAKLGYFLIHVYEHGHLFELVRTNGEILTPDGASETSGLITGVVHPRLVSAPRFGIDMRQNWLEVVEVPPSGSLDEFDRKKVRNDYPLLALLEMGIARVRIPAFDLLDLTHRVRLDACRHLGLRFTLFSFGLPDQQLLDAVNNAAGLVDIWEIADTMAALPGTVDAVSTAISGSGIKLYVSKIRSKEDMERSGSNYHHMIVHGFKPEDTEHISRVAELPGVDGLVFRVEGATAPGLAAEQALAVCRKVGTAASLHIRMMKGKPGDTQDDEAWTASRARESVAAAATHTDIHVYLDTFADVDRGYYRRLGIVDRFYNPRPAFHAIKEANNIPVTA